MKQGFIIALSMVLVLSLNARTGTAQNKINNTKTRAEFLRTMFLFDDTDSLKRRVAGMPDCEEKLRTLASLFLPTTIVHGDSVAASFKSQNRQYKLVDETVVDHHLNRGCSIKCVISQI